MDSMEEVSEWTKYLWDFSVLCKRFFLWSHYFDLFSFLKKLVDPVPQFLPQHLICPLTKKMFVDPVKTVYGTVYERKAIEEHLKQWVQGLSPHKVPKVVSQSVLLAMLTCFWHFTKWSGRLCSRVVNLLSLFQTPVWSDGWPRKRAWCEWHDGGQGHEENGDGSSSSPNSVNVGGNRLAED